MGLSVRRKLENQPLAVFWLISVPRVCLKEIFDFILSCKALNSTLPMQVKVINLQCFLIFKLNITLSFETVSILMALNSFFGLKIFTKLENELFASLLAY